MEENKKKYSNRMKVFMAICILFIIILIFINYKLYEESSKNKDMVANFENTTTQLKEEINNITSEKANIQNSDNITNNVEGNNTIANQTTSNNYQFTTKGLYDIISSNDSNLTKAQKIAKEFEKDVNNKDWYTIAKLIGWNADYYIKYGINNYSVDTNKYEALGNEYVFYEKYDWDKTKLNSLNDVGLGSMLTIEFKDGGGIVINSLSTGN